MQTIRTAIVAVLCSLVTVSVYNRFTAQAQTAAALMPMPLQTFLDANNAPVAGGKLCFYQSGSFTPQNAFTDSSMSIPVNPVILDGAGRASAWLGPNAYRVQLLTAGSDMTCSTGVTVWTKDGVTSWTSAGATGNITIGSGNTFTMQPGSSSLISASLVPGGTSLYNLGSPSLIWNQIRGTTLFGNSLFSTNITNSGQVSTGSLNVTGSSFQGVVYSSLPSTDLIFGTVGGVAAQGPIVSMSAATNASNGILQAVPAAYVMLASGRSGAGTYLPLTFWTGGVNRISVDASTGAIYPTTDLGVNSGSNTNRWGNVFSNNGRYYGTLTANSILINNTGLSFTSGATITPPSGSAPLDGTFTCGGGLHVNTFTVSQGILTAYACN